MSFFQNFQNSELTHPQESNDTCIHEGFALFLIARRPPRGIDPLNHQSKPGAGEEISAEEEQIGQG